MMRRVVEEICVGRLDGSSLSCNIDVLLVESPFAMGSVIPVVTDVGVRRTHLLFAPTTPSVLGKFFLIRVFASVVSILVNI
jgi:hypothetical protein